jgi:ATP/maltotriose-dependent transcriptional regulator MalT
VGRGSARKSNENSMKLAASQAAGTLLERADSLSALDELLAGVHADAAGRLMFVGGESGVGKTALVRAFCDRQPASTRILWGACEPLRTQRPLAPFLDIAEHTGGDLRELTGAGARPHEVAAALLDELGSGRPTVVVLEDVHWADEATLDVIMLLATRIGSAPALVLATYRDDELERSEQLRFVLGELVRRPSRLKVEPLSPAAVRELAQPLGIDGDELHRSTGGNPFFVTEVLAAGEEQIPETIRDAVLARAARLSVPARRLLEAVAVVPGPVEPGLLEALAGELGDRVDECLASGMLRAGRVHVAFRHDLARIAIEESIAPNRRLALHRAAIDALAATDDPDFTRLAHHTEAAGDATGVLKWAPLAAGVAAGSGAHREAAAQYARALRFADGEPLEVRTALYGGRAEECRLSAQIDQAIEAQERALECQRALGDKYGEGDSLRSLSRLLFFCGRVHEGEPVAREAIELLERLEPRRELAMAYGNLSQRLMVVEDHAGAVAWGTRATELATTLGDDLAYVYGLTNIAAANLDAGLPGGREELERARALARRHGLEDYAGRAGVLLVMSGVCHRDYELAEANLEPALEYCMEHGLDTWIGYLLAHRARMQLDRGSWDAAGDSAALVLRDPRSPPVARAWALPTLGLLRARRGDADSEPPLADAQRMVESTDEPTQITPVAAARAEAAWLAGDHVAVARVTDAGLALAVARRSAWSVGELACWRWRAGVIDELADTPVAEPHRLSIAGDWAAAAARWREIGCPYEAALALADGDDQDALRRAHDQLQALGAKPAAAIVARRLRDSGARGMSRGPRQTTRENPAGLTARELEVLGLLAQGSRNADIAQELVVSEKTVEHHVSAILRKLDVRTRGAAAVEAVRLGLATADD